MGAPPPAWLRRTLGESRLPPTAAVLVTIALQLLLPAALSVHPRLLLLHGGPATAEAVGPLGAGGAVYGTKIIAFALW